jgi:hypothetical protein
MAVRRDRAPSVAPGCALAIIEGLEQKHKLAETPRNGPNLVRTALAKVP